MPKVGGKSTNENRCTHAQTLESSSLRTAERERRTGVFSPGRIVPKIAFPAVSQADRRPLELASKPGFRFDLGTTVVPRAPNPAQSRRPKSHPGQMPSYSRLFNWNRLLVGEFPPAQIDPWLPARTRGAPLCQGPGKGGNTRTVSQYVVGSVGFPRDNVRNGLVVIHNDAALQAWIPVSGAMAKWTAVAETSAPATCFRIIHIGARRNAWDGK
jgi:hypothetical protein